MKVILLQDVAKIGRRFQIADVPKGHALNMLIPKGLAEAATPENLKKMKARADKAAKSKTTSDEQFKAALELIEGKSVVVSVQANEKGHLFEALKPDSIIAAIGGLGAVIAPSQLHIETPIKEVGEHAVELAEGDIKHALTITVTAA